MVNLYVWKDNPIGIQLMIEGCFDDYIKTAAVNSINSIYDAFFLFADYFLNVCDQEGLSYNWHVKYKTVLCDILEKLSR